MSDLFYVQVKPIDILKKKKEPQKHDVKKLLDLLVSENLKKYFFHDLENPKWIPILHKAGYFIKAPNLKEVEQGQFQLPTWYAGQFLTMFAHHYPEIVLEISQTLNTDNARAYSEVLKSLTKIPPDKAKSAASYVAQWLDCPFSDQIIYVMKDYLDLLLQNKCHNEILIIIDSLLEPDKPRVDNSQSEMSNLFLEAKPNFNEYWLKEIVRFFLPSLIKEIPYQTIPILEKKLSRALDLETTARGGEIPSSYWRSAIEDHEQNTSIYIYKDLLVSGIRDSLLEICGKDPDSSYEIISRFISSEYSIFRRIGYFILQYFGNDLSTLVDSIFTNREILDDSEIHHEIYRLLNTQFHILSKNTQQKIIKWLFDGPQNKEEILQWLKEDRASESPEEDLSRYCSYWTIRRIWAIRQYLEGKDKEKLEALVREYSEPDHPDLLSWSSGVQDVSHETPIEKNEIRDLQLEEIIQKIKTYTPDSTDIDFSRRGLAETLNAIVIEDPEHFVKLASLFMDQEIRFIYTYHYLMALKMVIESGKVLDLDSIFDLCIYIASLNEDLHATDKGPYEAGLGAAQLEVANLIESVCKKDPEYLSDENIESIKKVLDLLLDNPDPEVENEIQSGWDPATRSLNCVRGQAMHDLFHLARYQDIQARQSQDEGEFKPKLDSHIQKKLEEKLDKTNDPSLSVHAVFGWYTPLLEYLSKEWLENNVSNIFPIESKVEQYWNAAWDAYVSFNNVFKRTFQLLIPQYKRAISKLAEPEDPSRLGTTRGERLGQHLAYAYIHQLIDIKSDDELIHSFYMNANDRLRGHIAFWLGKAFGELKLESTSPIWHRMWDLFRWRLDHASRYGETENYQEEVSDYMRWLEYVPVGFDEVESFLRMSIPFLKEGYHRTLVINYLAKHCQEHPQETNEMLHELLKEIEIEWFTLDKGNIGLILEAGIEIGNENARQEAILIINLLGERGDFQWKRYLPSE